MTPFTRPMKGVALLPPEVPVTDENVLAEMLNLQYPVLASEKMDGIRGLKLSYNKQPRLLSYRLKLIPNKFLQERALLIPMGYDMELWTPELDYNTIQSTVMSEEHELSDKIQFHIIDLVQFDKTYKERIDVLRKECSRVPPYVVYHEPVLCESAYALFRYYKQVEAAGGEGICFRLPSSPYKQGRSTSKEQYLIKLCPWSYEETTIIGFEEQQENTNEDKHNNIGLMDRSQAIAGKEGKGTLGAFVCSGGFNVGTGVGLTNKLRQTIWDNQSRYLGRTIKYKTKAHGKKDLPRSPIFWGFRDTNID